MWCTYAALRVEEAADAVLELVEEHGVESGAELQAQQVLDVGADLQALLVVAHHQRQQPVQELAEGSLGDAVARAHGHHGTLALRERPHGGTVGSQEGGGPLLQAHPAQGTQEARHVYPLLEERGLTTRGEVLSTVNHHAWHLWWPYSTQSSFSPTQSKTFNFLLCYFFMTALLRVQESVNVITALQTYWQKYITDMTYTEKISFESVP